MTLKDFTEGKILRTHLRRPTWHLVTADDIRWLLMLTAPRVNAANAYMYRKFELGSTVFNRCNKILLKTLQGGKQLTRDALNEKFKRNKIIAEGQRLSYIMMRAELEGIICSGARQENQFTYALLEERILNSRPEIWMKH
ncbi:MAG: crosslink repair DNA glycosylase YcaQ family protein [Segetibacter sp.]